MYVAELLGVYNMLYRLTYESLSVANHLIFQPPCLFMVDGCLCWGFFHVTLTSPPHHQQAPPA